MTISSVVARRVQYNTNGVTTVFAVPFPFINSADIDVYETITATGIENLLVIDTDYTVTGGGTVPATGSVTTLSPLNNRTITILGNAAAVQEVNLVDGTRQSGPVIEGAFDLLTILDQENEERFSRAISVSPGYVGNIPVFESGNMLEVLRWNNDATRIESVTGAAAGFGNVAGSPGIVVETDDVLNTYTARNGSSDAFWYQILEHPMK